MVKVWNELGKVCLQGLYLPVVFQKWHTGSQYSCGMVSACNALEFETITELNTT